ncbi:hypothetical protein [Spirosoma validum]|uniref:Uncharacterized protein n=1 Tax=Spirosoma validum TaxID=2771355 RepID=A0A927AZ96_9BACT|nr:hypothetical protein [Spirosoma validum]MBD2752478.1 hypothetical protein [Spirosoma validum]
MTPEQIKLEFQRLFLVLLRGGSVEKIRLELEPLYRTSKGMAAINLLTDWVEKGKKEIDDRNQNVSYTEEDIRERIEYPVSEIFESISSDVLDSVTKKSFYEFYKSFNKAIYLLYEAKQNELTYARFEELFTGKPARVESMDLLYAELDKNFTRILTSNSNDIFSSSNENISFELDVSVPSVKAFNDLFDNAEDLDKYVGILRNFRSDKPVINSDNEWLGGRKDGSKKILIAWIDRLKYCKKIPNHLDKRQLARLLEDFFQGLKFGEHLRYFDNSIDPDIQEKFRKLMPL